MAQPHEAGLRQHAFGVGLVLEIDEKALPLGVYLPSPLLFLVATVLPGGVEAQGSPPTSCSTPPCGWAC